MPTGSQQEYKIMKHKYSQKISLLGEEFLVIFKRK